MMRTVLTAMAVMLWAGVSAVSAAPVIVSFSFTNVLYGGGLVEGVVLGLVDNAADQTATSVKVTSNADGYGLGEYVGGPLDNLWTVSGGQVTAVDFFSFGDQNPPSAVTDASLGLATFGGGVFGGALADSGVGVGTSSIAPVTFSVAPVPLPATLPLALAALGGLGLIARRRRAG